MFAHYLIHRCRGGEPIIDLFPQNYQSIPEVLLSSVCAYVSSDRKDLHIGNPTFNSVDCMHYVYITSWLPSNYHSSHDQRRGKGSSTTSPQFPWRIWRWCGWIQPVDDHHAWWKQVVCWTVSERITIIFCVYWQIYGEHVVGIANKQKAWEVELPWISLGLIHVGTNFYQMIFFALEIKVVNCTIPCTSWDWCLRLQNFGGVCDYISIITTTLTTSEVNHNNNDNDFICTHILPQHSGSPSILVVTALLSIPAFLPFDSLLDKRHCTFTAFPSCFRPSAWTSK